MKRMSLTYHDRRYLVVAKTSGCGKTGICWEQEELHKFMEIPCIYVELDTSHVEFCFSFC